MSYKDIIRSHLIKLKFVEIVSVLKTDG